MSAGVLAPSAPGASGSTEDRGVARHDSLQARRWTSRGVAKVVGDAEVGDARLNGTTVVGGRLKARRLESDGRLEVVGPIDVADRLAVTGEFHAAGTCHVGEAALKGKARCDAGLVVDGMLTVRGSLSSRDLQAGLVDGDGQFDVRGTFEAPQLTLRCLGESHLGSVIGRNIVVRARPLNPVERVLGRSWEVHVDRIEAERVEVAGAYVEMIRSPQVTLGPGAQVTAVEGTVVRQHSSARVGPESRSRPPHGLRR